MGSCERKDMSRTRMDRRSFLGTASAGACLAASAVGGVARAEGKERRIATFVCDVTPPLGTAIYSSYKPLATVEHPLLAKGVVLEDEGGRSVLCAVDWCELCNSTYDLFRQRIAEAAGTEVSRVAVQTVHQHTAPMGDSDAMRLIEALPDPPPYPQPAVFEAAAGRVGEAVRKALGALQPYDQVGVSRARVERVASNRRVPIGEGKVGFRASSCRNPKFIALPEGVIDPFLKTISFARDGNAIARLHYYTTHPQSFYGDPRASYDFPGMARERLQAKEGVFQIYFTGCAGDVACGKYNDASPEAREGLYQRLYAAMAASAQAAEYGPAEDIVWRTAPLLLTPRSDERWSREGAEATVKNSEESGLQRICAAMFLAWDDRAARPIELTALRMGKVSVLHLPGEPMIDFQLFAQDLRPDAFVTVAAYGDCGPAYICLEKAFGEGGYEPTASHVAKDSERVFRAAIRKLMAV